MNDDCPSLITPKCAVETGRKLSVGQDYNQIQATYKRHNPTKSRG